MRPLILLLVVLLFIGGCTHYTAVPAMKAIRLIETGKPLELQEIPIPHTGEKDILVRVRAAGICHSDAHYRAGRSTMPKLPITLRHEVPGVKEKVGAQVSNVKVGERVCLHYNLSCGDCSYCSTGNEQFCDTVKMIGHHVDGGYAEYIAVPARNAIHLPEGISFEAGATLMCASATALHALRKSRVKAGETVAVFGVGGLGLSAIQLAKASGAVEVFAVDIKHDELELASEYKATPIDASRVDAVEEIRRLTQGKGVDVALEMIGMKKTMEQAIDSVGNLGRAVLVGLNQQPISINTYMQVLGKEAEIIGSNDHLLQELPLLVDMARRKILDSRNHRVERIALGIGCRTGGRAPEVWNVHLENTARPSGRTRQATALAAALSDGPLIVGGDVNTLFGPLEGVAGAFEAAGLERIPLRYGRWLSPSIDQIFVRGASCAAGGVLRLRGSDHLPIVAEVEFAGALPGTG